MIENFSIYKKLFIGRILRRYAFNQKIQNFRNVGNATKIFWERFQKVRKLKKLKKIENTCTLEEKVFATFYTPRASSFGAVHNEFNIPGKDDGDAYSLMNYYFTLKPWQFVGRQTLVKAKFVKKAFNSNKKKKKKMPPRLTCLFGDHALFICDSFNIKNDKVGIHL